MNLSMDTCYVAAPLQPSRHGANGPNGAPRAPSGGPSAKPQRGGERSGEARGGVNTMEIVGLQGKRALGRPKNPSVLCFL